MTSEGVSRPAAFHSKIMPDPHRPWSLPGRVEDLADDPALRERAAGILDRSLATVGDAMAELHELGAVLDAVVQVRAHPVSPLFKLYLFNETDAFFGFCPVTARDVRTPAGTRAMLDLMGKDSHLFHHTVDDDPASTGTQYVNQARRWFDSVWTSVAKDYVRP